MESPPATSASHYARDNETLQPSDAYLARVTGSSSTPIDRAQLSADMLEAYYWHERVDAWLTSTQAVPVPILEEEEAELRPSRVRYRAALGELDALLGREPLPVEPEPLTIGDVIRSLQADLDKEAPLPRLSAEARALNEALGQLSWQSYSTTDPAERDALTQQAVALLEGAPAKIHQEMAAENNARLRQSVILPRLAWEKRNLLLFEGKIYKPTQPPPDWLLTCLIYGWGTIPGEDARAVEGPTRQPPPLSLGMSVPSDPFMLTVARGFYRPDRWQAPVNGLPAIYKEGQRSIYLHPGNGIDALTPEQEERTWVQVRTLNDDHYRALHIAMAVCVAENGGEYTAEKVRLHANRALELLGRKKKKGAYHPEDKIQLIRDVAALNQIWVAGAQIIVENKRKREVTVRSRLLEVAYETEKTAQGDEAPYSVLIALGDWARPLLSPDLRQTALLLREVLKIDPRPGKGLIASRLGLFLTQHWKIRAGNGNYEQAWKVAPLLEAAGIKVPDHREERRRLRENLDAALDLLQDRGIIAVWEYAREEQATPTNAFKPWLDQASIRITPPAALIAHYKDIQITRRRKLAAAARRNDR